MGGEAVPAKKTGQIQHMMCHGVASEVEEEPCGARGLALLESCLCGEVRTSLISRRLAIPMRNHTTGFSWAPIRAELPRALALALVTILIWCAHYDRWTASSWQVPLDYLGAPETGDIFNHLAWIKAAGDGHISPVYFNNVPELGAPYVANWNDFPLPEKPLYVATGLLSRIIGLFAAGNVAVLMAQVLAALSFFAAARLLGYAWVWAFAGGLVFAFARYAFAHGLHHLNVLYYWHVPLDLVVCQWLFRGEGIKWGGWRFVFAIIVAVVTAWHSIYYTYLFAQFVCFGGLYQAWHGGWKRALPAAAIVGSAVAAFLFMNLNTIIYQLVHGGGEALVRPYRFLEVYALKLVDLVVPPPDQSLPPFASWGEDHLQDLILSPGELPPTAYLGLVGWLRWRGSCSFHGSA